MSGEEERKIRLECYQRLQSCYDRLAETIITSDADPNRITELVDEADRIINELSLLSPPSWEEGEYADETEYLRDLNKKVSELENLFREEMGKMTKNLNNLRTGKKALTGYRLPRIGMGYTEGKFVDRKE